MRQISSSDLAIQNKRWLHVGIDEDLNSRGNYFPLPFGHGLSLSRHSVFLEKKDEHVSIQAGEQSPAVQLYPPFSTTDCIDHPKLGEIPLNFWVVNRDMVRQQALSVVGRTHYLTPPQYGLILGCRFVEEEHEEKLRDLAQKRERRPDSPELESPVWTNPAGRLIGCAVLAELLFGIPRGRDHFADEELGRNWRSDLREAEEQRNEENREPEPGELTRRRVVRKLRLTWASRFAVEKPFTGYGEAGTGIGTLLARILKQVAIDYQLPRAKRIEVIRTVGSSKAEDIIEGKREDFLTKAGYDPLKKTYSRPQWEPNFRTGQNTPPALASSDKTYRKLYYCAEFAP